MLPLPSLQVNAFGFRLPFFFFCQDFQGTSWLEKRKANHFQKSQWIYEYGPDVVDLQETNDWK